MVNIFTELVVISPHQYADVDIRLLWILSVLKKKKKNWNWIHFREHMK